MVKEAGEKVLGTKFCFSCQQHRPIETGKVMQKKGSSVWRCGACAAKISPMGFTKEKKKNG
jgi:predicted SprT family Zn-dependent metalloprotease